MAGIGVKLTNIYKKNTLTTDIIGVGYSTVVTIAPMLVVIGALVLMEYFLDFSSVAYITRELFSCTVLYIFIFSLLTASPFNSVLSKYMSDVIYEEKYEDILPCYYVGMFMNILLSSVLGIIFCVREVIVGKVDIIYVFTGYCGYIALVLVFYSMLYLSICKDYKKISLFFAIGMTVTVLLSFLLVKVFYWSITYGMLFSLAVGFWLIACLEMSVVRSYFKENSGKYREPTCIVKITDADGNDIYVSDQEETVVYKENAARMMTDMLVSVVQEGTGKGLAIREMPCAGKTGTTNDNKDGWFVGYTRYYTTSVWVGYDMPKELPTLKGSSYPGNI